VGEWWSAVTDGNTLRRDAAKEHFNDDHNTIIVRSKSQIFA